MSGLLFQIIPQSLVPSVSFPGYHGRVTPALALYRKEVPFSAAEVFALEIIYLIAKRFEALGFGWSMMMMMMTIHGRAIRCS